VAGQYVWDLSHSIQQHQQHAPVPLHPTASTACTCPTPSNSINSMHLSHSIQQHQQHAPVPLHPTASTACTCPTPSNSINKTAISTAHNSSSQAIRVCLAAGQNIFYNRQHLGVLHEMCIVGVISLNVAVTVTVLLVRQVCRYSDRTQPTENATQWLLQTLTRGAVEQRYTAAAGAMG
jgi:hypothetical protein